MSDSISPQDLPDATEPAPAPAPPHILKLPVELLLIVFASVSGLPDAVSLACSSRYLASVFDTNRYYIQLQLLHTHRNFTNPLTGFSFYDLTCKLLKVRQLICCKELHIPP